MSGQRPEPRVQGALSAPIEVIYTRTTGTARGITQPELRKKEPLEPVIQARAGEKEYVPPQRTRLHDKHLFHQVAHIPRISLLDRTNTVSAKDPFRGFYVLFWLFMSVMVLQGFFTRFESTGEVISMTFAVLMSRDLGMLALSDAVLVGGTFLCVPIVKCMTRSYLRYQNGIYLLQYCLYVVILGAVIRWITVREWPWVQSGFFLMHSMVNLMKMHSYLTVNGVMSDAYADLRRVETELDQRLLEVYKTSNIDDAWREATQRIDSQSKLQVPTLATFDNHHSTAPDGFELWARRDVQQGSSMERAQKLLPRMSNHELPRLQSPLPEVELLKQTFASNQTSEHPAKSELGAQYNEQLDPHPFACHDDAHVRDLATHIGELRDQLYVRLCDGQPKGPMWPYNATMANFLDFQLCPTLVYRLQYPRTASFRPMYLLERILATVGTFIVIYAVTVNYIIPVTLTAENTTWTSVLTVFLRLAAPMMLCYLLIFYIMFECVCNGFAELTQFADREFYQDWWNSASMAEFSRKWNRPVHNFLLQHVYVSLIFSMGVSKTTAAISTFLFSSVLHELVMILVSGKLRGYLFFAQMSQYPLILMARTKFIENNRTLGNLIFWIGLLIGFPLLNIAYLVY
ncbi:sterol O-acyltransferase [Malassezia vespertilionis]|nr:sterol O-acyltransferase [Malassezia vespertilionis]WFD05575.1 sterol O-acyltransferase [Malassezia vespertilionis]